MKKSKSTNTKTAKTAAKKAPAKIKPVVNTKSKTTKSTNPVSKKVIVAKEVEAKTKKTLPISKAKQEIVPNKTEVNKIQNKAVARVIEPLSWDAEKPKLNLNMQFKASKISKEKEELEVKSYSIKARYTVGDRVMHQDFGKGLVRDLIGDFKIRVAFRDFEKVLVHGIN